MDLFYLLKGITKGTSDYVTQQREENRKREDAELESVRRTLENMQHRPDFDSREYESLLGYMGQLSLGPGKLKKGVSGFLGQHEHVSPLIASLTHGDPTQPFVGDPKTTKISDDKMSMFGGGSKGAAAAGAGGGPADPSTSMAPESSQAGGGDVPAEGAAPAPTTTAGAAGVPGQPVPMDPQAAGLLKGMQPVGQPPMPVMPSAAKPQGPGAPTGDALKTLAIENNSPVAKMTTPPPLYSEQDIAAERAKRPTGMGRMFSSAEEQSMDAANKAQSTGFATKAGDIQGTVEGTRQEFRSLYGREPSPAELRQFMTTKTGTMGQVWASDPSDPRYEIGSLRNSLTGDVQPLQDANGSQMRRLRGVAAQTSAIAGETAGQAGTRAASTLATGLANAQERLKATKLTEANMRQMMSLREPAAIRQIMAVTGQDAAAAAQTLADMKTVTGGGGGGATLTPPPAGAGASPKDAAKDRLSGVSKVTGSTQTMMEGAKMLQPHIKETMDQAKVLNDVGLFGPMMSRVRDAAARIGTVQGLGSDDLDTQQKAMSDLGDAVNGIVASDPSLANDERVGQFLAGLGLLMTGAARVHGGARGGGSPQMLQHFKQLLGSSSTIELFNGRMKALDSFIGSYAKGPGGKGGLTPPPAGGEAGVQWARDEKGKLHKGKAGTALPKGWTTAQAPK
jgi:hypothetical protein